MHFEKVIALLFCFLLLGCYDDRPKLEVPPVYKPPSKFVVSKGYGVGFDFFEEDFNYCFNSEDLDWENTKDTFYVVLEDSVNYIMSLPIDGYEAEIYMLYPIEDVEHLDETRADFENCVEKYIRENMSTVYDLCRKKRPVPQLLGEKIRSFLVEGRLSIISTPGYGCTPDLRMFYFDGEKYHYFDMIEPDCFDNEIKKDPRIPEYIEFYNEMAAFITQDFGACRWDNFGNRDEMIRECGKFNWRWREKYPDLVK